MNVEVLIVGQGLAGTTLALELERRGISYVVVDQGLEDTSSSVAAGLYNPVAYKRMLPSWNSHVLLEKLLEFFKYSEDLFNEKFVFPKHSYKIFSSEQDRDSFVKRPDPEKLLAFTDGIVRHEDIGVKTPFGYLEFSKTGYVYVRHYVKTARRYFIGNNRFLEERFREDELQVKNDGEFGYKSINCKRVIYCTGHEGSRYWNYLPFRPVKGELMLIKIRKHLPDHILVKDGFMLPVEDGNYVLGSTYVWDDLTNEVTEKGTQALLMKLGKFTDATYEILEQKAGIRPASHDRRPYVGWNPVTNNIGILNGLGSKGVLYAPFCAALLVDSIENQNEVPEEVNVKRVRLK